MVDAENLQTRFGITALLSAISTLVMKVLGVGSYVPLANPVWFETYAFPTLSKWFNPSWFTTTASVYMAIAMTFIIFWMGLFILAMKLKLIFVVGVFIAIIIVLFYFGILHYSLPTVNVIITSYIGG